LVIGYWGLWSADISFTLSAFSFSLFASNGVALWVVWYNLKKLGVDI